MTPTGWYQFAWSDEVAPGQVHPMTYFGREMVAWRSRSGRLSVMDAYCEHLGAHLGHGGHVEARDDGDVIQCPFHGWQWDADGNNVSIPYEPRPNPGRRMRTYPVVERNESVYIWHDVNRCDPYFDAPDVFASFSDGSTIADYYPQQRLYRAGVRLHPQYVLENGVDFAHFKFVHKTPIVPLFTRHDFDGPVSYVDFTITFEGDDCQSIDDVKSGVEAINGGLGVAVTKSWGMVDNRTISAITPVDEITCDVRFMVYIGRLPGDDSSKSTDRATAFGQMVIDQFAADIEIWSHQRYQSKPALAPTEQDSFMEFRRWAAQFYPDNGAYTKSQTL
ncbi:MAG: Rieske 2Fe-2S domain-containing protein [Mycobacterium sp.]